ncbi:MAG: hypothetical protein CMJ48_02105 [Planctomycetaceae bacterium]|nr:hypothetical protein [Planctomycetaceae bacterium]
MAEWFFREGEVVRGPVSSKQLLRLSRSGRVLPGTPVSQDREKWHRAEKIRGLFDGEADHVPIERVPPAPWARVPKSDQEETEAHADAGPPVVEIPAKGLGTLFGFLIWSPLCLLSGIWLILLIDPKSSSAAVWLLGWMFLGLLVLPGALYCGRRWGLVRRFVVETEGDDRVFSFARIVFGMRVWSVRVPLGPQTRFSLVTEQVGFGRAAAAEIVDAERDLRRPLMREKKAAALTPHLLHVSATLGIRFENVLSRAMELPVRESRLIDRRNFAFRGVSGNEWLTIEPRRRSEAPTVLRLSDIRSIERQRGDTLAAWLVRLTVFTLIFIGTGGLAAIVLFFLGLSADRKRPLLWIALHGTELPPEEVRFASDRLAAEAAAFLDTGLAAQVPADGEQERFLFAEPSAPATGGTPIVFETLPEETAAAAPFVLETAAVGTEGDEVIDLTFPSGAEDPALERVRRRARSRVPVTLVGVGLFIGTSIWLGLSSSAAFEASAARGELLQIYQVLVEAAAKPKMDEVQSGIDAVIEEYGRDVTIEQIKKISLRHENAEIRLAAVFSLTPYVAESEFETFARETLDEATAARLDGFLSDNPDAPKPAGDDEIPSTGE